MTLSKELDGFTALDKTTVEGFSGKYSITYYPLNPGTILLNVTDLSKSKTITVKLETGEVDSLVQSLSMMTRVARAVDEHNAKLHAG